MELVGEDTLPQTIDLPGRVGRSGGGVGNCREKFDISQQQLAAAVITFVAGLGGVGAAVELKIELTDPGCQIFSVGFKAGEEIGRSFYLQYWL